MFDPLTVAGLILITLVSLNLVLFLFRKPGCPDCGPFTTCKRCGERLADVDEDIDRGAQG